MEVASCYNLLTLFKMLKTFTLVSWFLLLALLTLLTMHAQWQICLHLLLYD